MTASTQRFAWLHRPAPRGTTTALAVFVCVLPALLLAEPLASFMLRGDDFWYFGESRTWERLGANLWLPHNLHVVPFFRVWTRLVMIAAGSWENLQRAAAGASYFIFVLAIVATGLVVRGETGRSSVALMAMSMLGISTVAHPTVTWFSASPVLWAGFGIISTIGCLGAWRRGGDRRWLVFAVITASVAIGNWNGGFAVGPVAAAYLWMDGRPPQRRAALAILTAGAAAVAAIFLMKGPEMLAAKNIGGRDVSDAVRPLAAILNTTHGIGEFLVVGNFGLHVETTREQAAALVAIAAAAWLWARRSRLRLSPLEAAGGTLVLVNFLLAYSVRGYLPFTSLRTLVWYRTLPQVGLVLFAAGGWSESRAAERRPLTVAGTLSVLAFAGVFMTLHLPAARDAFLAEVPRMSPSEEKLFPTPELRWVRATTIGDDRAKHQRRFLARLDRIESTSRKFSLTRDTIHDSLGRMRGPGVLESLDVLDILDLPNHGAAATLDTMRGALGTLVAPEPLPRPSWLAPEDEWPPPEPPR